MQRVLDSVAEGLDVQRGKNAIAISCDEVFRVQQRTFDLDWKHDNIEQLKRILGAGARNTTFVVACEFAQANLASVQGKIQGDGRRWHHTSKNTWQGHRVRRESHHTLRR